MALVCIPRAQAEKLKNVFRDGTTLEQLSAMTTKERHAVFEKHVDKNIADFFNKKFETALHKKTADAMVKLVQEEFGPRKQETQEAKGLIKKIRELEKEGLLDEKGERAFLEDYVTEKLGVRLTEAETKGIVERSKKLEESFAKIRDDIGDVDKRAETVDFMVKVKEMENYINSLTPESKLKVSTGTIGRGMMLASPKSPILNIESNTVLGVMEALVRRIASNAWRGTDGKLAMDYMRMANEIYNKTGYDISRLQDLSHLGLYDENIMGQTVHTQGKGVVHKTGQIVEDIVFKNLMGAPDAAFARAHFVDTLNLLARKATKGDLTAARALMKDAMLVNPKTEAGKILKMQGIFDAQVATLTNKSWANKTTNGLRKIVNDLTGDFRMGDILFPFVQTPANWVATGIKYSGGGAVGGLYTLAKLWKQGNIVGNPATRNAIQDIVRSGLGIAGAYLITQYLTEDDFVGAFDSKRAQEDQLRNTTENSIKVNNKWVSLDYFSSLAVPIAAMMYAKQMGAQKTEDALAKYALGVLGTTGQLPVVEDILKAGAYTAYNQKKDRPAAEIAGEFGTNLLMQARSRLIPSVLTDIARGLDIYERKAKAGVEAIQAGIPGLRQQLPPKENIFAEPMKTEGFISTLLFGSRVKTAKDDALINELRKVTKEADTPLSFTDWDKTNSTRLLQFRAYVGEMKYIEKRKEYGKKLRENLAKLVTTPEYKKADATEKAKMIKEQDDKIIKDVLSKEKFTPISKAKQQSFTAMTEAIRKKHLGKSDQEIIQGIMKKTKGAFTAKEIQFAIDNARAGKTIVP